MYTPVQSLYIRGSAGDPLPTVFQSLHSLGTIFRRGQLCLVSAGAGTGKSAFILTYAMLANVPTLYFSADSDAFTQNSRMLSILTGAPLEKTTEIVRGSNLEQAEAVLNGSLVRLVYDATPSLDRIETVTQAFEEVYGDFPKLVVIDNITNVVGKGGDDENDPFSGLEGLMDYLHTMARNTQACVVGLHHVTGEYANGDKPVPLNGVKQQIHRVPEMVLTLHKITETYGTTSLNVSPVKNRGGVQDASGMTYASLEFIGEKMWIRDYPDQGGQQ